MSAYPIGQFLVITHARVAEERVIADDGLVIPPPMITMCAHCRRVQPVFNVKEWTWIPSLVASPPDHVSHGLCPPCAQYYYPE